MEEQKVMETVVETTEKPVEETVEQPRKKVFKDQDFYPVCAIIICISWVVCQSIGSVLFPGNDNFGTYGMLIGIALAALYIAKGGKQIDTSPTKPRTPKSKKNKENQ